MKLLFRKTFVFSLICHLFCFTLIGFSLPKLASNNYEITFLGSFLSNIDFLSSYSPKKPQRQKNLMLDEKFMDKIKIKSDKMHLVPQIDKPQNQNKVIEKNIFLSIDIKDDIINEINKLTGSLIYIPNGFGVMPPLRNTPPSNLIKARLIVAKNGRVEFVERLQSSGNLESDLLVRQHLLNYIYYPRFKKDSKIEQVDLALLSHVKN